MSEPAGLLNVAEALADGLPIDWTGLAERDPAMAGDLERLRAVADVVRAFRSLRAPHEDEAGPREP